MSHCFFHKTTQIKYIHIMQFICSLAMFITYTHNLISIINHHYISNTHYFNCFPYIYLSPSLVYTHIIYTCMHDYHTLTYIFTFRNTKFLLYTYIHTFMYTTHKTQTQNWSWHITLLHTQSYIYIFIHTKMRFETKPYP